MVELNGLGVLNDLLTKTSTEPGDIRDIRFKVQDSSDRSVGKLSSALRALWVLRERERLALDEAVSGIEDVRTAYSTTVREKGDRVTKDETRDFQGRLDTLMEKTIPLHQKFKLFNQLFWSLVALESAPKPGVIRGVREGFLLVERDNDNRDDEGDDPINRLSERSSARIVMMVGSLLHQLGVPPDEKE